MPDYITKEQALTRIKGVNDACETVYAHMAVKRCHDAIRGLPPADVAPMVHGRWKDTGDGYNIKCSACRTHFSGFLKIYGYCPNCGARMDGVDNA